MKLKPIARAVFLAALGGSFSGAQENVKTAVDLRVAAWRPTEAERRVDDIAWAEDIRAALRRGRESGRPVFVFTHDGRLGLGRQ